MFLRAIAPTVALSPPGITWVVYSACDRARVPKVGAHRLRHTLACDVLRAGGSLVEISQILRHAAVGTSAIYAKVDFSALATLAHALAGGCGMSEHTLRSALGEYLAIRRSLGFKLARDGLLLEQFVGFCEQTGARRASANWHWHG